MLRFEPFCKDGHEGAVRIFSGKLFQIAAASKAKVLLKCFFVFRKALLRSDQKPSISSASMSFIITIVWHRTGTEVTWVAIYQEFAYK